MKNNEQRPLSLGTLRRHTKNLPDDTIIQIQVVTAVEILDTGYLGDVEESYGDYADGIMIGTHSDEHGEVKDCITIAACDNIDLRDREFSIAFLNNLRE